MQRGRSLEVVELLAEPKRETREPFHVGPHREILALNVRCARAKLLTANRGALRRQHLAGRVFPVRV